MSSYLCFNAISSAYASHIITCNDDSCGTDASIAHIHTQRNEKKKLFHISKCTLSVDKFTLNYSKSQ